MEQVAGGHRNVFQHCLVRKEVERLEHHPHFLPHLMDGVALCQNVFSVHINAAARGSVQQVQAAKQRALARTGRADDGDNLAAVDVGIDIFQHLKVSVALLHMGKADEGLVRTARRRSRLGDAGPAAEVQPQADAHHKKKKDGHAPGNEFPLRLIVGR